MGGWLTPVCFSQVVLLCSGDSETSVSDADYADLSGSRSMEPEGMAPPALRVSLVPLLGR